MEFRTIEDILDFAIRREEAAAELYTSMAERVTRPEMREALISFAEEEQRHRQRLLKVKAGELPAVSREKIHDLRIADYVVQPEPTARMDYPEALRFAMNAEKAAFRLYSDLARSRPPTTPRCSGRSPRKRRSTSSASRSSTRTTSSRAGRRRPGAAAAHDLRTLIAAS